MSDHSRYDSRGAKSDKILTILRDQLGDDLSQYFCLDVGCANGAISTGVANSFRLTIGIDLDRQSIETAVNSHRTNSLQFALASGHEIPFPDNSFDVIICAQVYEHSTDQTALAREIFRVLRPGGVCFFSGPNRLSIMEEHYWLPFLSWLPRPLANRYMQLFSRGEVYDAYPHTYWTIRRLWQRFRIVDYTLRMIRNPEKYSLNRGLGRFAWFGKLPDGILKILLLFLPNYNWILVKN